MNKLCPFFLLGALLTGCSTPPKASLTLLVPSGAPFLSVAKVKDEVQSEVTIGPDLLPVAFTKGEKDLIIAPVTLGAKLYNAKKSNYTLDAVLGWGNLHIVSRSPISDISDLQNKNILAFAEHSTPGIMLRLATKDLNVSITYFKSVSDIGGPFLNGQYDYVLLSEPILSKILSNIKEETYTYSLQNVTVLPRIAQFGIFSNVDVDHQAKHDFYTKLENNIKYINELPETYAKDVVSLDPQFSELGVDVIKKAIPNLNFEYKRASDVKDDLNVFFNYLVNEDINIIGANNVDDNFYGKDEK